jgi:hypothetical protein
MEAIPRGLLSRDMIKMIPGIKCLRTNILPSHHSGNHQFTSTTSNKLTFQIPSFPNSSINTKWSFIRFVLKTSANGVLVPQGLRGWEFCTICQFFANFFNFTKIHQVPSFQSQTPVKTVFAETPKNARNKIAKHTKHEPLPTRYANFPEFP